MRLVAQFTVGLIDSRQMKDRLKHCRTPMVLAATAWRRWALGSYYWGSLWRAVVTEDPERWQVHPEDVELIRSQLKAAEKRELRDLYMFRSVERLQPEILMDLHRQLQSCAWKTYHTKLRFVSRHDPGLPAEDIVADLLEVGFRALRRYEHQQDPQKTLNYARRSVVNRANSLAAYYSRPRRARLVASDDPGREYACQVVSFSTIQDALEHQPAKDSLFDKIRIELGPRYEGYARALLGQWPDFDAWVVSKHKKRPEKLPEAVVEQCARRFSGINEWQAQTQLGPLLAETLGRDYLACSQPT